MTITEKTAYLKGLLDGMKLKKDTDEARLFTEIVDTLNVMALAIADLEEDSDGIHEELDMIEQAIDEIDDDLEELDQDVDDLCELIEECCDIPLDEDDDWDEDETFYELVCPTCGEEIVLDEDVLVEGEMKCPACGEELEFDLSELEAEDGCACGCGCDEEACDCDDEGCACGCEEEK